MKKEHNYYVYIATNQRHTVLYTGVTNNLFQRADQHQTKINKNNFTAKYNINKIIYYELYNDIYVAIEREKQIKNLVRRKKISLINSMNPKWNDMIDEALK